MTWNEAHVHLQNILRANNPDPEQLVRTTEQRILGSVTARGRTYDGRGGQRTCYSLPGVDQ